MCRLSKKVEKDRKCREEEGLGCCLKSGKIERWLKRSIDRSSITKHWYIHDIPWKISWPIIIYFHSITLLYLRIPHIDHIFIIIVSYSLMHYLSFFPLIFPPRTFATFSKKKTARIEGRTKRETPIETTIVPAVIVGKFLERNVRILEYIIIIVSCSMDWTVFLSQAKKKEMGEAFRQNG